MAQWLHPHESYISGVELPDIPQEEAELSSEISAGKITQAAVESMKAQEETGREKAVVGDMGTLSML